MFRRVEISRRWMAVAAVVGAMAAGGVARADHDSFEWRGPRHGFHGEDHIIRALANVERAYDCRGRDEEFIETAVVHTRRALRLVCHSRARSYLRGAYEHMIAFEEFRNLSDLDDAARLLRKSLATETSVHVHDHDEVVVPLPRPARHRDRGGMYFGSRRGGVFIRF